LRPDTRNWMESSQYDLETAQHMLASGRYLYVIYMCHLSLEKLLKAAVTEATGQPAPRSHDLISLAKRAGLDLGRDYQRFVGKLNDAGVIARYPEDMRKAMKDYTEDVAGDYLRRTEELAHWLRAHPLLAR